MPTSIFFCFLIPVYGWGGDGHRIITQLALNQISDRTQEYLYKYLGSQDGILTASVWADTEAAELAYPGSAAYHFCNTPYRRCGEFRIDRDCGRRKTEQVCIVTALADAISSFVDIELDDSQRTDALKFVIHLMGDIHQPLHVGFRHDFGGNAIKLDAPEGYDLHRIWDNWLVDKLQESIRGVSPHWRRVVDSLNSHIATGGASSDAEVVMPLISNRTMLIQYTSRLATNTAIPTTCTEGYTDHVGMFIRGRFNALNEKLYLVRKLPIVRQQLGRAGHELAQLIEAMVDEVSRRTSLAKAARREARIANIFSQLVDQTRKCQADDMKYAETQFSVLAIDFYPETDESVMVTTGLSSLHNERIVEAAASKRSSGKTTSAKRKSNTVGDSELDALLAAYRQLDTAATVASRNYEMFNGIDLSRIGSSRFVVADGRHIHYVTDSATLRTNPNFTWISFTQYETYLPSANGSLELTEFRFDNGFFKGKDKAFTIEIAIRAMLKLANKDCTIDISEYLRDLNSTAFYRVKEVCKTCMNDELFKKARTDRAHRIIQRSKSVHKLSSITERYKPFLNALHRINKRSELVTFHVGRVFAIFTLKTLRTAGDGMRANYLRFVPKDGAGSMLLIDTDIYEGCRKRSEVYEIQNEAISLLKTRNSAHLDIRPTMLKELNALGYIMFTKDEPSVFRSSPERAIISDYAYGMDEDPEEVIPFIVWERTNNSTAATRNGTC